MNGMDTSLTRDAVVSEHSQYARRWLNTSPSSLKRLPTYIPLGLFFLFFYYFFCEMR